MTRLTRFVKNTNDVENFTKEDVGSILATKPTGGIPFDKVYLTKVTPTCDGGYVGINEIDPDFIGDTINAVAVVSSITGYTLYILDVEFTDSLEGEFKFVAFLDDEVEEGTVLREFTTEEVDYINEQHKHNL
ncbi:hypothetical protein [Pseudoalteromonas phage J2-1_QLiu-2017]|nr:hypothetical protein [Pseudoalteromonas phage J2-1_QLiu-2017]